MNETSLLHAVLDTLEDGVCLLDAEGRVEAANAAASALLGGAALAGREAAGLLAGGGFPSDLARVLAGGGACQGEGGAASYRLSPLPGGGALLRLRGQDAAWGCSAALRDSESKLRAILDTLLDGVIAIDAQGAILVFNPAAEALFGYRREEILGQNVKRLMPPPDREAHDRYLANYLTTGVKKIIGIGREVLGRRKDGSLFPLYLSIGEAPLDGQRLFVAVVHDLTARKKTEEKLLNLSRVVEQSPNAVTIAGLDWTVEYVNPSFTRLTGYAAWEAVGKPPVWLGPPPGDPGRHEKLRQALLAGGEWREEIQGRKKNGEAYWALETVSPMRNAAGQITHFLGIQQNITEQKRALEALRVSEERFRQVAEMSGEWLWEQDEQGRYLYSSGAVRQILGYGPEEILGQPYLNLLTEEDKRHWTTALPPTPEVHEPFFHLVNRYRHKDGHEVFTESTGEPIFGADGRLVKWRGVDHDITARKHYEDALRLRDRAIEAASVGINIADARARGYPNIYVNSALSRITGYSREELLGRDMRLLQGPDTDRSAIEAISQALADGRGCELVLKNYRKEGTPFWNELLIAPVRDPEAVKLTHFIGVHADVTERRRAEAERHELEIAKQIQLSLLPKAPLQGEGVRVAGACVPATHVGGDYYDYFFSRDTLNVVVADVSGHSVGAALVMAGVRGTLKAEARKACSTQWAPGAAAILAALNELLHEDLSGSDLFITMFYLSYDPAWGRLCYASAGHNPPLLLCADTEACIELDAEGMVLGVSKDVAFEEKCMKLARGDRLLLYTDGITEAQDPAGEFFGVARLRGLFAAQRHAAPEATIEAILQALHGFCGSQSFSDDVSLVVMQIE
jgi:sigma-B regulation protein RsbU (phosphoserine phosphatase)